MSYGEGDTDPRNNWVSFGKVASQLGSTTPAPRPPKPPLLLPTLTTVAKRRWGRLDRLQGER